MEIIRTLVILGIGQAFFIGSLLVWNKRENRKANRILGVFLILVGASLIPSLTQGRVFFGEMATTVLFVFGPMLLLYFHALTGYRQINFAKYFIHFIPFLINLIFVVLFAVMDSFPLRPFFIVFNISRIVSALTYAVSILVLLGRYQTKLKNERSTVAAVNLDWLKYLLIGFLILFSFIAVIGAASLTGFGHLSLNSNEQIVALGVTLFLFSFGFFGFRQAELFYTEPESEKRKYQGSTLSQSQAVEYAVRLREVMDRDKPFLDPDLNLQTLSRMSKIPHYHLSQVINEQLKVNFYDYINSYRIDSIKNELNKDENNRFTILGLALDHGFNSKSAFNKAFKQHTGLTPSAFKRNHSQLGAD